MRSSASNIPLVRSDMKILRNLMNTEPGSQPNGCFCCRIEKDARHKRTGVRAPTGNCKTTPGKVQNRQLSLCIIEPAGQTAAALDASKSLRTRVLRCWQTEGKDLSPHPADAALANFDYDDTKLMSQEKVLIVEDEEHERSGLAELVGAWGYRTETAKDGAEGLEKFTSWAPAIVVTDIKMPRMTGMQLLDRISAHPQQAAVILLTAQR